MWICSGRTWPRLWVALAFASSSAWATELFVRIEAGPSVPLTSPQRDYYTTGLDVAGTGSLGLLPWLDGEGRLGYSVWPVASGSPKANPSSMLGAGLGLRARRPLDGARLLPWADAVGAYARSGPVNCLSAGAGVGLWFRTTARSPLLFGPYARYQQVFALGEEPGFESADAGLLSFGVGVEFLTGELAAVAPVRAVDADGDGLADSVDSCPQSPGPAYLDGCPDSDGDGMADAADRCPNARGLPANEGCPDDDPDRDGVLAGADACPAQPGLPALEGCPDLDGDGISDSRDACPQSPGKAEDGGCPRYRQLVVTETKIELKQKIFFAFGTTSIMPKSFELLGEVVQALSDRVGLCVRIEGHTDNRGDASANLLLSDGRAGAVRTYLLEKGVSGQRLESRGYGETLPMDDNATADGRENNRRVEFVLIPCKAPAP